VKLGFDEGVALDEFEKLSEHTSTTNDPGVLARSGSTLGVSGRRNP
jgi:hypothetical protein